MKRISNYYNAFACEDGFIYRKVNNRYIKRAITLDPENRPRVMMTLSTQNYKKRIVAQLIAEAFLGPKPKGLEVCHNDGDPLNNKPSNLRYDTHKNNMVDMANIGHSNRGRKNYNVKLNEKQVLEIRKAKGTNIQIGRKYNVGQSRVSRIKNHIAWYWL